MTSTAKEIIEHKLVYDRAYAFSSGKELACGKKIKYGTMQLATIMAYRLEETKQEAFEPYACPYCFKYHIGHVKYDQTTRNNN